MPTINLAALEISSKKKKETERKGMRRRDKRVSTLQYEVRSFYFFFFPLNFAQAPASTFRESRPPSIVGPPRSRD